MTAENHYQANLRDIEFNLFEFHKIQDNILGQGPFTGMDEATARASLDGIRKITEGEFASSYVEGDRVPLKLDDKGDVTLPPGIKRSLQAWYEAEWHRLELPERMGGYGAPPSLAWAAWEMLGGSNAAVAFYLMGTVTSRVIDAVATEEQKKRYVGNMVDKCWGSTMVLTEPNAGSDVGAGRTSAKQVDGELYHLEGVKRFITNGDYDATENIVHLVLARPEGARAGTKGLSLFIVPKFWVDEEGNIGERNGVRVTNIEKKMGLKASATCEMTFGGDGVPARGLLVGNVHDGIRQMFLVIEQARMCVGIKSMSHVSAAYYNALNYAKERVQGPDLMKAREKDTPRVTILHHPDVRRILMNLKSHGDGMRALITFAASIQDQVQLAGGHATAEGREIDRLNDLLLPLIKGYCSERSWGLLSEALQVYGGSGYCMDYPIEQYIRDQKIDTLYEGTTGIQALDLFFRKVAKDGGETLKGLFARIQETLDSEEGGDALAPERALLKRALDDVGGMFMAMMGKTQESLYHVGLQGNRILYSLAELTIGWLLVRQSALALTQREGASEADRLFYEGKVSSARYFAQSVFPAFTLHRKMCEKSALDIMEIPENVF